MPDLSPSELTKAILIGMGLVAVSMVVAFVLGLALGGFKMGSLARQINLDLAASTFDSAWAQMHQRILNLGFTLEDTAGSYIQGGAGFLDLQGYTHARTRKRLKVEIIGESAGVISLGMTLAYLDPIVGDTGESAYRDAVLDYVSGQAPAMKVVPNKNYAAFSSLVGGVVACVAVPAVHYLTAVPVLIPISLIAATEIGMAILAIITIRNKPAELKGTGLGIGGMIAAVTSFLLAAALMVVRWVGN